MAFKRVQPHMDHENPKEWTPECRWAGWGCKICGRAFDEEPTGRPRELCHDAKCRRIYKTAKQRHYREVENGNKPQGTHYGAQPRDVGTGRRRREARDKGGPDNG